MPLAQTILQQCAFLYADGIVQSVFAGLDELAYDEALDVLLRYSLLNVITSYSIHYTKLYDSNCHQHG